MPSPKVPSAKVLARRSKKVELNLAAISELDRVALEGMVELSKEILSGAEVPDRTPFGEGLVDNGGLIAYVDKKVVATYSTGPDKDVKKPRAAKVGPGVVVIAGFGFPARYQESGTVHQPARPFLTPALMRRIPEAGAFVKRAAAKHGLVSARRAAARAAEAGS